MPGTSTRSSKPSPVCRSPPKRASAPAHDGVAHLRCLEVRRSHRARPRRYAVSLLVLEDAAFGFGARPLWSGLSWTVAEGERWALLGPNGAGKSTLLAVLAGTIGLDAGKRRTRSGLRIAAVGQRLDLDPDVTALDAVVAAAPGRTELVERCARLEARLEAADAPDAEVASLLSDLAAAHEALAHLDQRFAPHRAARILDGLGLAPAMQARRVGELSGGMAMRVALAACLFAEPDLLLLDEPTNHLDVDSVRWLASYLPRHRAAQIVVTHDLEFAERVADHVASFEPEGIRLFAGPPSAYRKARALEAETLERRARNEARKRREAERFVERFRAKASKARAVRSRVRALERMEASAASTLQDAARGATFRFAAAAPSGRVPVRLEGVAKGYGGPPVLHGLDLAVVRGQKIGIVGRNGAGKTTLVRLLAGELEPDEGRIVREPKVKLAFFAQHHADALAPDPTVLDTARAFAPNVSETRLRAALGAVGLGADDVDKQVRVLSGGERARLALACRMVVPANTLVLDEPTNHLDAEAAEALAHAVAAHEGTVVFVSHHLDFLRRAANVIWLVGDGRVEVHPGTFDDFEARLRQEPAPGASGTPVPRRSQARADGRAHGRRVRAMRDRRKKLAARLATIEAELERAQRAVEAAAEAVASAGTSGSPERIGELGRAYEAARAELQRVEAAWIETTEAIEALDEALAGDSSVSAGT
ncbi:MAG: ABC transporter ATP-binding protein [Deltaproteobacteria bacterium]|nr:MAG: ABC transporter ATP-binding protein [Deltaproteobacteria bacterium]